MREKPEEVHEIGRKTRITPACAGKTRLNLKALWKAQANPREGGQNRLGKRGRAKGLGSPPRVREKRVVKSSSESYERITPACAGKTEPDTVVLASLADHPRVCGKNSSMISLSGCFSGSPPRVREKRVWKNTTVNRRRITPACAGKTWAE